MAIYGLGQVVTAQGFFSAIHCPTRAAQRIACSFAFGCSGTGQILLLATQLVAQCLLAIGQRLLAWLAATAFGLIRPLTLTALAFVALATALTTIAAFVTLAFTGLSAGIELFLQIAEGLIAQPLLFAQSFGQPFLTECDYLPLPACF